MGSKILFLLFFGAKKQELRGFKLDLQTIVPDTKKFKSLTTLIVVPTPKTLNYSPLRVFFIVAGSTILPKKSFVTYNKYIKRISNKILKKTANKKYNFRGKI